MTPFGLHMRALRERKGVTQRQMAEALNVSSAYLSALEHGKRGVPSYAMLQRITGYFNVIWDEAEGLHRSAQLSDPRVVVDTSALSPKATELANRLSETIASLDEADLTHLLETLNKEARE